MLELRHVQELRGARDDVQETRGADVSDTRWETRLLAVLAAILVVFGLAAVYGAASLVMISGGQVGSGVALRQALGAAGGGGVATIPSRTAHPPGRGAPGPGAPP